MDHADHVALLRPAISAASANQTWADIGAGAGTFTLALAELLGPGATLIAVDRDAGALARNALAVIHTFPGTQLRTLAVDFRSPFDVPALDGLVAANSLHFVARTDQVEVIRRLAALLKPDGTFVVVEYDTDSGNPWVPHPFSALRWREMAAAAGLVAAQEVNRVPSRFLGAIYSAMAHRA